MKISFINTVISPDGFIQKGPWTVSGKQQVHCSYNGFQIRDLESRGEYIH
jgi:hypothetical protein